MIRTDDPHHRRSVRLPDFDYAAAGAYFVTIVTHDRLHLFGEITGEITKLSSMGRVAEECWQAIPAHFPTAELGAYVVMPNHLHGIIILHEVERAQPRQAGSPLSLRHAAPLRPHVKPGSLAAIVRSYKSAVTREIGQHLGAPRRVWQRNYYEHVIRDAEDWDRIHLYIESNILNWAQDKENV